MFFIFLLNHCHNFYQTQTRVIELNSTNNLLHISYTKFGICRAGFVFNSKVPSRNFSHWNNDDVLFSLRSFFYLQHAVSVLSVKFITNLFWCCKPYISPDSFIKLSLVIHQPISLRVSSKESRNSLIIHLMTLSVAHTIYRIINCKWYARRRICPNLRYRRSMCVMAHKISLRITCLPVGTSDLHCTKQKVGY
jgi:hypothetical protein